jgi:hypothetical protein
MGDDGRVLFKKKSESLKSDLNVSVTSMTAGLLDAFVEFVCCAVYSDAYCR